MKSFMKSLKRQDGFTLVELMVVVAIIGLLSAVAIPNFKKYQAKAKITEAKLQLSAIYTAQAAFYSDYNMYAACLSYMGYSPVSEVTTRYYATGFPQGISPINAGAVTSAQSSGLNTAAGGCDVTATATADRTYFVAGKGIGGTMASTVGAMTGNGAGVAIACTSSSAVAGSCVASQADLANMAWRAVAVGYISADNLTPATASGLNINERKIISSVVQGF